MDTRTKEKRTIRWLCNGVIEIGKDARLLAARQDHEHIYTLAVNRLGTKKYEDVGCTEV